MFRDRFADQWQHQIVFSVVIVKRIDLNDVGLFSDSAIEEFA